jgi:large subunit ribosomal protein L17
MMKNMARSLVEHEQIRTTEAKAKELRVLADKLVTMALENSLSARRRAYAILGSHRSVKKLFDEIGPRFTTTPGGYTRVVKFSVPRVGDGAPMAVIEFTQREAVETSASGELEGAEA